VEVAHLRRVRDDENTFETLWAKAVKSANIIATQEAEIGRKCRLPQQLVDGSESHHSPVPG